MSRRCHIIGGRRVFRSRGNAKTVGARVFEGLDPRARKRGQDRPASPSAIETVQADADPGRTLTYAKSLIRSERPGSPRQPGRLARDLPTARRSSAQERFQFARTESMALVTLFDEFERLVPWGDWKMLPSVFAALESM